MRIFSAIAPLLFTPLLNAAEWSIDQCSALDLLAGRTGIADVRPTNDPHHNSDQMVEQNSGIYRGQWSWQSEMPELLYGMMHSGNTAAVSPSGFTPLQAACVYADEGIFRVLVESGVPVETRPLDWQQLGYVGDTPLGLLIRFMTPKTAAKRVRMARVLLEKGANPDAAMTTWKGNRVVTVAPFCELDNQACNHEMRMLLLEFGDQNLSRRMAAWQLNWEWFREDLVEHLQKNGVVQNAESKSAKVVKKAPVGRVPLLDLIRKGDVEGVRAALEAGASIEISARARRYGHEPLYNIPVRRKDSPEVAIEIARLLIEAGADINDLNRRGHSLRIHYDRYRSKASRALCAYLKEQGAFVHPDSPANQKIIEQRKAEKLRLAQEEAERKAAEEAARLAMSEQAAPQPEPVQPEVTEDPAPQPEPVQPEVTEDPAPQPEPVQPEVTEAPAPQPEPVQPEEAPAQTEAERQAEAEREAEEYRRKVMEEVQRQLQEIRLKYEEEARQKELEDSRRNNQENTAE